MFGMNVTFSHTPKSTLSFRMNPPAGGEMRNLTDEPQIRTKALFYKVMNIN